MPRQAFKHKLGKKKPKNQHAMDHVIIESDQPYLLAWHVEVLLPLKQDEIKQGEENYRLQLEGCVLNC